MIPITVPYERFKERFKDRLGLRRRSIHGDVSTKGLQDICPGGHSGGSVYLLRIIRRFCHILCVANHRMEDDRRLSGLLLLVLERNPCTVVGGGDKTTMVIRTD